MIRPAVVLLLAAALLGGACGRQPAEPPAGPPAASSNPFALPPDWDVDNLLSLVHGATVVDRTAEFSFERSAVQSIDGDGLTVWSSPPAAADQTITYMLGARTLITAVGTVSGLPPKSVRFETSLDGSSWTPLVTVSPAPQPERQTVEVPPREAAYVRIHTAGGGNRFATLASVLVIGRAIAPAASGEISGCWLVNGRPARFERDGARVRGVIEGTPPRYVDGGLHGRIVRAMWVEGPLWGHALLTVSPDGTTLSGVEWFGKEVKASTSGAGLMGRRGGCPQSGINTALVRGRFMERVNRYHLYGLRFAPSGGLMAAESRAALDELENTLRNPASQRFRIVAHEFGEAAPDKNSARAAARLDSLREALSSRGVAVERLDLVAGGGDPEGRETITLPQKLMIGSVDLQRVTR